MNWKPKEGETYCIIKILPEIIIKSYIWWNDNFDKYVFKQGNCFRTKKEAEDKLKAIKKILKERHCEPLKTTYLTDKEISERSFPYYEATTDEEWQDMLAKNEVKTGNEINRD